jgi:agmatinase
MADGRDSSGFDADGAAVPGSSIFGLTCARAESAIVLVPAPLDATVSYGVGTAEGPSAILRASHQVELFDAQTGRPYARGIHMLEDVLDREACTEAARLARPLIEKGGAGVGDGAVVAAIDAICGECHDVIEATVSDILQEGCIPGVVGGDHSVAFGGIAAVARRHPGVGILQVDAHADLRHRYEGFAYSHASIMDRVLADVDGVSRLVQVGVRDVCEAEVRRASEEPRVVLHHDIEWKRRQARGESFLALCEEAIAALPEAVHVSFDIDGLDPKLCPNTGTPVPGGLQFHEACLLLQAVVESGRRIVAFDLTEVAPGPGPDGDEWDANVGARILYKLCGFAGV